MSASHRIPECYGVSFYVPGEGQCSLGCSFEAACREAYIGQACTSPEKLADEERSWLQLALGVAAQPPVTAPAPPPPGKRKRPERWTEADRKPLASFKPDSVAVTAAGVLREHGRAMHLSEITDAVLARMAAPPSGKTPRASVGLALRNVLEVRSIGRGMYEWTDAR